MSEARVVLASYTTLRLGGPAARFATAGEDAEIVAGARVADDRGEPLLVLGGGSNLVVADDGFPGVVLRVATRGIARGVRGAGPGARAGDAVEVRVAAGEDWDRVVAWSVAEGLSGLECLSGIPGSAGATPIQNVGAYGQEVAQTVIAVRAYDRARRAVVELSAAECGFGYRDSVFKRSARPGFTDDLGPAPGGATSPVGPLSPTGSASPTGRFVVLAVVFALTPTPLSRPVRYAELARALGIAVGERAPLADVRAAVLGLRRGKGMVLDDNDPDTRSAGSFFTNPVLEASQFAALERAVAGACGPDVAIPRFAAGPGQVKVSAAWLIERAGFGKGYRPLAGNARISGKHTLALVNPGGATTADLLGLAGEIRAGVRERFGVELAAEPVLVGAAI